jgi:hypothetical protein
MTLHVTRSRTNRNDEQDYPVHRFLVGVFSAQMGQAAFLKLKPNRA